MRKSARKPESPPADDETSHRVQLLTAVRTRPLSREDLDQLATVVTRCRQRARKNSPDARLPVLAGQIVRRALPDLLLHVDTLALLMIEPRMSGAAGSRRGLRSAQGSLTISLTALRAALRDSQPFPSEIAQIDWQIALGALERLHASNAARLAPMRPNQGRRPLVWRRALLVTLAAWWCRQDWTPTVQSRGCFLSVARHLLSVRLGRDPSDTPDFNPATVRTRLREGRSISRQWPIA